jgi:hypothetical protein
VIALAQLGRQGLALRRDLRQMRVSGVMNDRRALQKTSDRARYGVIDRGRSLATSGHENDGPVRGYPELGPPRLLRPREERAADRIAVDERAPARQYAQRPLERRADPLRPAGKEAVYPAGYRVALPDVDRDARHPRGEHRRERGQAAGGAADIWAETEDLDERLGARDGHEGGACDKREPRIRIAQGRHHGGVEGNARGGHEISLEAATTTDKQEDGLGILFAERFRDREERAHVSGRPATDEKHAARSSAERFGLGQR